MQMVHRLEIEEPYADAVVSGDKNFEVRYDDRGYQRGDIIDFFCIESGSKNTVISHPIDKKQYIITYVLHGWGMKDGWCAFGIKEYFDGGVPY